MNIAFRRRSAEASSCENSSCAPSAAFVGGPLAQLLDDSFLGDVFGGVISPAASPMPLDVTETEASFTIRADLPGFKKDQISLDVEKGVLTIRAAAEEKREESAERFHLRERRVQGVTRRLALPDGVQEQDVTADLTDGVLTVILPKAPQAQPRKIAIK